MQPSMICSRSLRPSLACRPFRAGWAFGWGLALGLWFCSSTFATEAEARAAHGEPSVAELIDHLNDDRYSERRAAAERLADLLRQPQHKASVAGELQAAVQSETLSFEAWQAIDGLLKAAGPMPAAPTAEIVLSKDEVAALVEELESDDYGLRLASQQRLAKCIKHPTSACYLLIELKARLAQPGISNKRYEWLANLYDQTRTSWMMSDPKLWQLPDVTDDQITQLVNVFGMYPGDNEFRRRQRESARRDLLELLVRDDYYKRVEQALRSRLAAGALVDKIEQQLEEVLNWCHPAMVAEIWSTSGAITFNGDVMAPAIGAARQRTAQFLLIDVPWRSPDNPSNHSSHFDYCDDDRAHCVDGYTLLPGDYPVGVAFPHPQTPEHTFFHIVNLPTPRRRMIFDHLLKTNYQLEGEQDRRLREITRRTCDAWQAGKLPLTREQIPMLGVLDKTEISKFVAHYLGQPQQSPDLDAQQALDRELCQVLCLSGTKEAMPGILAAIEKHRLPPPNPNSWYHAGWLAFLAIGSRSEGADVERLLAQQIIRQDPLLAGGNCDVGGAAAAILLMRHDRDPLRYGLVPAQLDDLEARAVFRLLGGTGLYRFSKPESRAAVVRWWSIVSADIKGDQGPIGHPVRTHQPAVLIEDDF